MFRTRLLSGIVLVIIIALMNVIGGPFMDIILLLVSLQGLNEFLRAVKVSENKKINGLEIVSYAGCLIYYVIGFFTQENTMIKLIFVIVCVFVMLLAVYVFTFPKFDGDKIMKTFFGFFYVPVMLQFVFQTRELEGGVFYVWLIYISSWMCDTSAYCVGKLLGKHKLAPVLSPKKSVEGSVGGVIGATLVSVLFAWFCNRYTSLGINATLIFAIIGFVGSLVSQVGDLTASAFKRNNDIKDYGKIIPGHGGILDRFDSVIFTAPMIYFLIVIMM